MSRKTVAQYIESLCDGTYKENFVALVKEFGEDNLNKIFYLDAPCQYLKKSFYVRDHIEDVLLSAQDSIDEHKKTAARYTSKGDVKEAQWYIDHIVKMKDTIKEECEELKKITSMWGVELTEKTENKEEKKDMTTITNENFIEKLEDLEDASLGLAKGEGQYKLFEDEILSLYKDEFDEDGKFTGDLKEEKRYIDTYLMAFVDDSYVLDWLNSVTDDDSDDTDDDTDDDTEEWTIDDIDDGKRKSCLDAMNVLSYGKDTTGTYWAWGIDR